MTPNKKIIASCWNNGVFVLGGSDLIHELPNRPVRGLSHDLDGGVLAIVDGQDVYQRKSSGQWERIAHSDYDLSVTLAINGNIYVGTDDARVLSLDETGELTQIDSFDRIDGRDTWFAGTAIINGREVGPPLGIRSMSGSRHGRLFANVHVGGIPRSDDGGVIWMPTINVDWDAHEVCVSPYDDNLVVAATASGLCVSHDGGNTWNLQTAGLHDPYCSAVAITEKHIFVAASEGHFTEKGAIYRRSVAPSSQSLEKLGSGLPEWLRGIADTSCIATDHDDMALISAGGDVFVSQNAGHSWNKRDETIAGVSSVLIV